MPFKLRTSFNYVHDYSRSFRRQGNSVLLALMLGVMTWPASGAERGELASYSNLFANGISSSVIDVYLAAYGMGELTPVPYGVAVCRILYWTQDTMSQNMVLASGAVQIPLNNGILLSSAMPLLMYAHGTESYRWSVPSCPHDSPTGPYSPLLILNLATVEALTFSSAGYCVFAPDYAGLGFDTTSLVTPYLIADGEAIAVIDGLRATQQFISQINLNLNGRLFLTGYSQGGHVCLATHRLLEQDYTHELRVTAAAPGGAPADLSGSMIEAFRNNLQGGTSFASFAVAAYQPRFHLWHDFNEVFLSAYTNVPALFYGAQYSLATIASQLPTAARELFTTSLIEQATNPASAFGQTIASNNVYQWRPLCPVTFFYAGGDTTVSPSNSVTAYAAMQGLGADVNLVNVGNGLNHATGFAKCQTGTLQYFNRYRYTVSAVFPSDFDGDGMADPAVYDSLAGTWRIKLSASGYTPMTISAYGGNNYTALAADFDGDRKADPVVCDAIQGNWLIKLSASQYAQVPLSTFGASNWPVLAADFDGDGMADPAFYQRDSNAVWSVRLSGSGYDFFSLWPEFGGPAYLPLTADFDGDGMADPAVYETTTGAWHIKLSSNGYLTASLSGFGGTGYTAFAADFDGDGMADPAIYGESNGYWIFKLSSIGYIAIAMTQAFGGTGYIPVPADYDGDGLADPAVWQASTATLSEKLSASGYTTVNVTF